jgi:hypothetical protein
MIPSGHVSGFSTSSIWSSLTTICADWQSVLRVVRNLADLHVSPISSKNSYNPSRSLSRSMPVSRYDFAFRLITPLNRCFGLFVKSILSYTALLPGSVVRAGLAGFGVGWLELSTISMTSGKSLGHLRCLPWLERRTLSSLVIFLGTSGWIGAS